jgi:hypothetical protein
VLLHYVLHCFFLFDLLRGLLVALLSHRISPSYNPRPP